MVLFSPCTPRLSRLLKLGHTRVQRAIQRWKWPWIPSLGLGKPQIAQQIFPKRPGELDKALERRGKILAACNISFFNWTLETGRRRSCVKFPSRPSLETLVQLPFQGSIRLPGHLSSGVTPRLDPACVQSKKGVGNLSCREGLDLFAQIVFNVYFQIWKAARKSSWITQWATV